MPRPSPPDKSSVVAIIAARNEADIVDVVIRDLVGQGVGVYFMDDGSTDGTLAIAERYLNKGVIAIEELGRTLGNVDADRFRWHRILQRKAEVAFDVDAAWFIHHDADEFRESPWRGMDLCEAIGHVDTLGFNAIDFVCLEFWPLEGSLAVDSDVRKTQTHYAPPTKHNQLQIRCWRQGEERVDLASSGGHEAKFANRRVCPTRFILRHYPVRSQAQGERKVFGERRTRYLADERARGWHVQYDALKPGESLARPADSLIRFDRESFRLALEACEGSEGWKDRSLTIDHELSAARDALAVEQQAHDATRAALADARLALRGARDALLAIQTDNEAVRARLGRSDSELCGTREALRIAEAQAIRMRGRVALLEARGRDLLGEANRNTSSLATEVARARGDLRAVLESRSWKLTAPLRAMHSRLTGTAPVADAPMPGLRPVSDTWGIEKGVPIDRYYIDAFLRLHRRDIRGSVVEVKDSGYAVMLGGEDVTEIEVLDIDSANTRATIVCDLTCAHGIQDNRFDCFILTQTLHIIYDMRAALVHAARILKPGGVLLCTLPAVSRVNPEDGGLKSGDYWRLTGAAVRRLFEEVFPQDRISVETYGNVRVCSAFLYGFAAEQLSPEELAFNDPWFPLLHGVRAQKSS